MISLEFDPVTGRWSMRYGMWSYTFRSSRRDEMHREIMDLGADAPAAVAVLSLLG